MRKKRGGGGESVAALLRMIGSQRGADERNAALTAQLEADPGLISTRFELRMGEVLPDSQGRTPLHVASEGDADAVRILLDHGADPNAKTHDGRTPLHVWAWSPGDAGFESSFEIPDMLLAHGAAADAQDENGYTPLLTVLSASLGHHDEHNAAAVAKWLIERGADVNIPDTQGRSPVGIVRSPEFRERLAEFWGEQHAELLSLMEQRYGAPTSVCAAALQGDATALSRLLREGGDANEQNQEGTALHCAVGIGDVSIVQLLIEHGARVDAVDSNGWTPLHRATWRGDFEVARCLIDAGANLGIRDSLRGMTPIDMAREKRDSQLVGLLGARPASTQSGGATQTALGAKRKPWWRLR